MYVTLRSCSHFFTFFQNTNKKQWGQTQTSSKANFWISTSNNQFDDKRVVASAKRHGINFHQGTPNSADGNCALESVLNNIKDRTCFDDSFPFSVDYYRRIWVNRTVNDPTWNIYSNQQWEEGWKEMMEPGVYERGLFGDLMMFAIACGVRKILLIFNSNLNSPHDPIYLWP